MTTTDKKVVCIGGGTGLSTLLRGLKLYCDPTAVVTMADSGGHSGILRDELGVLPPGDIRACLVALADEEDSQLVRKLFNYRFLDGMYAGANIGNLLLTALSDLLKGFDKGVAAAGTLLGIHGQVLPVTLKQTDLLAELIDGTILFGERVIDLPRKNGHVKIKRTWLQPKVPANPKVLRAIKRADLIVLGPGDLYTSILPNLQVDGMTTALQQTKAKVVYVANIMTKHGETDGFQGRDFAAVVEQGIGRPLDAVIYNTTKLPSVIRKRYELQRAEEVVFVNSQANYIGADILSTAGNFARHDSHKLAEALVRLINGEVAYAGVAGSRNDTIRA